MRGRLYGLFACSVEFGAIGDKILVWGLYLRANFWLHSLYTISFSTGTCIFFLISHFRLSIFLHHHDPSEGQSACPFATRTLITA
jgi:hypothetical protein